MAIHTGFLQRDTDWRFHLRKKCVSLPGAMAGGRKLVHVLKLILLVLCLGHIDAKEEEGKH